MAPLETRVEVTAELLRQAAISLDIPMSGDGRIGEHDAARLLAIAPSYLKQLRHEGRAPPAYAYPLNGSRISYRISDLARDIELRRDNFDPIGC